MASACMSFEGRLRIRNKVTGNSLCFPGPATVANGWSFPRHTFSVGDLNGKYVGIIDHNNTTDSKNVLKVCAVLTRSDEIAPDTYPLSDVDKNGWVEVLLGNEVLPFTGLKCVQVKKADVSGIETPPTPPPPWAR